MAQTPAAADVSRARHTLLSTATSNVCPQKRTDSIYKNGTISFRLESQRMKHQIRTLEKRIIDLKLVETEPIRPHVEDICRFEQEVCSWENKARGEKNENVSENSTKTLTTKFTKPWIFLTPGNFFTEKNNFNLNYRKSFTKQELLKICAFWNNAGNANWPSRNEDGANQIRKLKKKTHRGAINYCFFLFCFGIGTKLSTQSCVISRAFKFDAGLKEEL